MAKVTFKNTDIKDFEIISNGEEVLITLNDGTVVKKGIYHLSNNSLLCSDFETYIKFNTYITRS